MKIILDKNIEDNTLGIYLCKLIEQYRSTTGKKILPEKNDILLKELNDWLKERFELIETYQTLLNCMDIDYNNKMTAEIGKGIHDTVCYDKKTTIITPYTYKLNKIKNKVIKAKVLISCGNANIKDNPLPKIDHLITQNPYRCVEINNWEYLFNDSNMNATIGVFGKIYDKDKESKIKMLKEFKNRLNNNYREEYYKVNDEYGYVLTKKRKWK